MTTLKEQSEDNHIRIEKLEGGTMMASFATRVIMVYGPYAFGVASMIIIWFFIAKPELDRSRKLEDKLQVVVDGLTTVQAAQLETSRNTERTAIILDAIVDRLTKQRVE